MTSDELYDLFRQDVVDVVQPYLWTDEEIYAYMNDAYFMFVRLTGGISDFTSPATEVQAIATERSSSIDESILSIRQATLVPDNDKVKVINAQNLEDLTDEDYGIVRDLYSTTQGKVRYMVIGLEPGLVQWVNIPDQNYDVKLLIERLPLEAIEGANQDFTGVAEHHHIHFLKWMKYHAYRKQDTDAFDLAKSDLEEQQFVKYCDFATKEKLKYRHKVRVIGYGGI